MAKKQRHAYNGSYEENNLDYIAFPMGGMGAGMLCLEGTGTLSHFSLHHAPNISYHAPVFAALSVAGSPRLSRVMEGPVPTWKIFGYPNTGGGCIGTWKSKHFGLPRFGSASFQARFPFATVSLEDPLMPLKVEVTGWSPFIPGDADNSSLPVAGLEYRFHNPGTVPVEAVFSFHSQNVMQTDKQNKTALQKTERGFILRQSAPPEKPWEEGAFCVESDFSKVATDCAWFRGGHYDTLTMLWNNIERGAISEKQPFTEGDPSSGASLYHPITVNAGETVTICLRLCWYVPKSNLRTGKDDAACEGGACCPSAETYTPWYVGQFADIESLAAYWREHFADLRRKSDSFSSCFYDTTLPPEVVEAVAANLAILKSPTVLRQKNGRMWGWEGCFDNNGCCPGSCTHVWNYAQALAHLFPALERSLRQTEFNDNQNQAGHQKFRASLPVRDCGEHEFHAAADGQLGGMMKVYRDWRISGDTAWLKQIWPKVKASLDYCIRQWDPGRKGMLEEPHHNTYDIEFWGPDGMCSSFYAGALQAAIEMGKVVNEDTGLYQALLRKCQRFLEKELFNGEYFEQKVEWKTLKAPSPVDVPTLKGKTDYIVPEAVELLEKEGPKYQYGTGCLSDGLLGAWLAAICGLGTVLNLKKIERHLRSVYRNNFKKDLSQHANPQRPGYALGKEGGLLLCTWPKGGKPSLPFIYSDEVWTGIEYQVASHLMMMGRVKEGLTIVRACRDRYDGSVRNPFDEYECGHWYARALSSYALLQGLTGARYDAVDKVLYLHPSIKGDFRAFLSTATGFGTVGIREGKPFLDVKHGVINVSRIELC